MHVSYSRSMYNIIDKLRLPFRKERELFSSLYSILGFYPDNIEPYKTALIHRSLSVRSLRGINNERLEFLGDAILGAIVADVVFNHFPNKKEGFLTDVRSKIVKRESLGKLSDEIGLTRLIRNANYTNSHNNFMGGNALEALIGAIYTDKGYSYCVRFIRKRIIDRLINIDQVAYKEVNFKSKLIEWSQKNRTQLEYKLISETRDAKSNPVFEYVVLIEGIEGGKAKGFTKKESQQEASKITLSMLKKEKDYADRVFTAKSEREDSNTDAIVGVPIFS